MKETTDTLYQGVAGSFFALLAYLVGGFDKLIIAYALFLAIDYFTGSLAAWYNAELNSYKGFRGVAKKAVMLCIVIVANQVDIISGNGDGFVRGAILMILIGIEGISIMENGAKVSKTIANLGFLRGRLEQLQGEAQEKLQQGAVSTVTDLSKEGEGKNDQG